MISKVTYGILKLRMLLIMLWVSTFIVASAGAPPSSSRQVVPGVNMDSAKIYCDTHPIDNLEGVWSFPDDNITLFIQKVADSTDAHSSFPYRIVVLSASDQALSPGLVIGYISVTPESDRYRVWLYTGITGRVLNKPKECEGVISEDGYSLLLDSRKVTVKFNPLGLLPNLWRIMRLREDDPTRRLSKGFIKIYPSYDGNGSFLHIPRYLQSL